MTQLEQDYKNAQIYLANLQEANRVFKKISKNRRGLVNKMEENVYKAISNACELVQLLEDVQEIGWELTKDIVVDED